MCHRVSLVAAGVWVVVLSATSSVAAAAEAAGSCCSESARPPAAIQAQDPYPYQWNPLGFRGLASTEQNAGEGTLGQGPAQVDAEVGAGEHDVVDVARAVPRHSDGGDWVVQGVVILLALSIVSMGVRLIFKPSDQIPRVGGGDR